MKKLIGAVALLLMFPLFASAQNANPQYRGQGYFFLGRGNGTGQLAFDHVGGGGQALLVRGLGVGGELGAMGVPAQGVGVLSIDPSYHFLHAFHKSKVVPFVEGGYTRTFAGETPVGPANLFNFGGGINYWFVNKMGLRLEFRDYVHHVSCPACFRRTDQFWGLRVGLTFRGFFCAGPIAAGPRIGHGQNAPPKFEVFFGGSNLREYTLRGHYVNYGAELAVTRNFNRFLGLETDLSKFGDSVPGAQVYQDNFRLLLGPHFAHHKANCRVSPFAHVLVGLTHGQECPPTASCYLYRYPPGPLASKQVGGTAFTAALGGGLDVQVYRFFWVRPIQADFVRVFFPYAINPPAPISSAENNLQLSIGLTFRFGSLGKSGNH